MASFETHYTGTHGQQNIKLSQYNSYVTDILKRTGNILKLWLPECNVKTVQLLTHFDTNIWLQTYRISVNSDLQFFEL